MLSARDVTDLLADAGVRPKRSLGQNFVTDPNTVRKIARLAQLGSGDKVIEIGGGLGSLTLALAETGAEVVVVEKDDTLLPILRSVVASTSVRVVGGDALELDWESLLGSEPKRWALVGNLPYNVATPLILEVLDSVPPVGKLLVMVQREVAERLVATAGSPAYGAVSVKIGYWADASVAGRIPPTVFHPRPKVESSLVRIVRRPEPVLDPRVVPYAMFRTVVNAGFATRRKMLRSALSGICTVEELAAAGIDGTARAETLGIEEWGRIAERVARRSGEKVT